jgi:hypothetical protein
MPARKPELLAETNQFPFEKARLIANALNGDTVSTADRPLIYMAEDIGDGRARVAALQRGQLAFYP